MKDTINHRFKDVVNYLLKTKIVKSKLELSAILGVSPTNFQHYFSGKNNVSAEILAKLSIDYSVSAKWLLTGEGEMIETECFDNATNNKPVILTKVQRLNVMINYFSGGVKKDFAARIGVSPSAISKWIDRHTYDADVIYQAIPELNAVWLLNGVGVMLQADADKIHIAETLIKKIELQTIELSKFK